MAGHELALSLGQVEGEAVDLADHGDHVDEQARDHRQTPPQTLLSGDDPGGGHRARGQEDREDGQAHAQLVGDDLSRASHRTQQRVGGVGGPSTQDEAVDPEARDRQDVEDGDGVSCRGV